MSTLIQDDKTEKSKPVTAEESGAGTEAEESGAEDLKTEAEESETKAQDTGDDTKCSDTENKQINIRKKNEKQYHSLSTRPKMSPKKTQVEPLTNDDINQLIIYINKKNAIKNNVIKYYIDYTIHYKNNKSEKANLFKLLTFFKTLSKSRVIQNHKKEDILKKNLQSITTSLQTACKDTTSPQKITPFKIANTNVLINEEIKDTRYTSSISQENYNKLETSSKNEDWLLLSIIEIERLRQNFNTKDQEINFEGHWHPEHLQWALKWCDFQKNTQNKEGYDTSSNVQSNIDRNNFKSTFKTLLTKAKNDPNRYGELLKCIPYELQKPNENLDKIHSKVLSSTPTNNYQHILKPVLRQQPTFSPKHSQQQERQQRKVQRQQPPVVPIILPANPVNSGPNTSSQATKKKNIFKRAAQAVHTSFNNFFKKTKSKNSKTTPVQQSQALQNSTLVASSAQSSYPTNQINTVITTEKHNKTKKNKPNDSTSISPKNVTSKSKSIAATLGQSIQDKSHKKTSSDSTVSLRQVDTEKIAATNTSQREQSISTSQNSDNDEKIQNDPGLGLTPREIPNTSGQQVTLDVESSSSISSRRSSLIISPAQPFTEISHNSTDKKGQDQNAVANPNQINIEINENSSSNKEPQEQPVVTNTNGLVSINTKTNTEEDKEEEVTIHLDIGNSNP